MWRGADARREGEEEERGRESEGGGERERERGPGGGRGEKKDIRELGVTIEGGRVAIDLAVRHVPLLQHLFLQKKNISFAMLGMYMR